MSEFKGFIHPEVATHEAGVDFELNDEVLGGSRPMFGEFDPHEHGGIGVMPNGRLFEMRHISWTPEATALSERVVVLPYILHEDGDISFVGPAYDPAAPTMGAEFEVAVCSENQRPWPLAPDGLTLIWPDGDTDTLANEHFTPEALVYMVEYDSGVATSYADHRKRVVLTQFDCELLWEAYSMTDPALSVYHDEVQDQDISKHPYIQKLKKEYMPNIREFGVMSDQLTVQMLDPEAALYALSEYQEIQALVSLLTAAAPLRDGSFETTIGQHYRGSDRTASPMQIHDKLPAHDFAWLHADTAPYDWRELARHMGSPSSGTFRTAAPQSIRDFLQQADSLLRDGAIPTSGRTLGWHTDRLREQGRIEICNIATAGGNLHKVLAVQELVSKYLTAKQLEHTRLSPAQRSQRASLRQAKTDAGHRNNVESALYGKASLFITAAGQAVTPQEALQTMLDCINTYPETKLSQQATTELLATITCAQHSYATIHETFAAFFEPNSTLTAGEALHYAHKIAPHIAVNDLLTWFSRAKRTHVYTMAHGQGLFEGMEVYGWEMAKLIKSLDAKSGQPGKTKFTGLYA